MNRSLRSSRARGKRVVVDEADTKDLLSKLPKEILINIISRLCTSEAMRTSKYAFINQHAFQNCGNLKNLTLICVFPEIEVFNLVLVSCPNLEVLSVDITVDKRSGLLKIDNHKLKFLYLSCDKIDRIEVSSPNLDILSIGDLSCTKENFVIADPRHKFNRDYWTTGRSYTNYNISCPDQEEKSIAHTFMIGHYDLYMCQYGSMSVRVDLKNTKEVKMLQEILAEWPGEIRELEIVIKNNDAPEREDNKFWEEKKPFSDACFKAYIIRMFNFSGSKEEFALASYLIKQRTVIKTLMIKVSSNFASNKMDLERTMTKLVEFSDGDQELDIMVV
ncbi:unnamed protein product [Cochlearia groenlandica]